MSRDLSVLKASRPVLCVFLANSVRFSDQAELIKVLPQDQKSRIISKKNVADQEILLVSQFLQRYVGSLVSDVDWKEVCIERTQKQKPYFTNTELRDVQYSVSHAKGIVGMVYKDGAEPVGLDMVNVSIYKSWSQEQLAVMESAFHKDNWAEIKGSSGVISLRDLLMFWTLQEAYYKLLGVGVPAMDALGSSRHGPWIDLPLEINTNPEMSQATNSGGYHQVKQVLLKADGQSYFGTVVSKDDIIIGIVCVRPFFWKIEQIYQDDR